MCNILPINIQIRRNHLYRNEETDIEFAECERYTLYDITSPTLYLVCKIKRKFVF